MGNNLEKETLKSPQMQNWTLPCIRHEAGFVGMKRCPGALCCKPICNTTPFHIRDLSMQGLVFMWGPATSPPTDTEGRLYWLWSETHRVQILAPPLTSFLPAILSLSFFTCKNLIIVEGWLRAKHGL